MTGMKVLEHLMEKAIRAMAEESGAEQVIALQTAAGNVHVIYNQQVTAGNYEAEKTLFALLEQERDTHVLYVAALWRNGGADLPSFHFRRRLIELDHRNFETLLLMQGADGYHSRAVGSTL